MENLEKSLNETMSPSHQAIIYCFLPTTIIVPPLALPANALVLRLLLFKPGISCTSDIFTLQLATFDMLFCLLILIEYIRFLWVQSLVASNFIAWSLNQAGGPLLLCLLSLDSYLAVCHPLLFRRLKDPRFRPWLCFTVIMVTAISCYLVKFSRVFKWSALSVLLSCATAVVSICSILILRSLQQAGPSGKAVHPVKRRAFNIILTSLVLILVHYLPSFIEYLLRLCLPDLFQPYSSLTSATYLNLSLSSIAQPVSYLIRTKRLPTTCNCRSETETKTLATVLKGPDTSDIKHCGQ